MAVTGSPTTTELRLRVSRMKMSDSLVELAREDGSWVVWSSSSTVWELLPLPLLPLLTTWMGTGLDRMVSPLTLALAGMIKYRPVVLACRI